VNWNIIPFSAWHQPQVAYLGAYKWRIFTNYDKGGGRRVRGRGSDWGMGEGIKKDLEVLKLELEPGVFLR